MWVYSLLNDYPRARARKRERERTRNRKSEFSAGFTGPCTDTPRSLTSMPHTRHRLLVDLDLIKVHKIIAGFTQDLDLYLTGLDPLWPRNR